MARPLSAPRGSLPHPHPSPAPFFLIPSIPSNSRPLLLRLAWTHSPLGPTLSFAPSAFAPALLFRRRKGTRSVPSDDAGSPPPLALFWDLTAACYDPAASPEPLSGYYFVAVANAEVVLAVGDLATEFVRTKFEGQIPKARFLPLARRGPHLLNRRRPPQLLPPPTCTVSILHSSLHFSFWCRLWFLASPPWRPAPPATACWPAAARVLGGSPAPPSSPRSFSPPPPVLFLLRRPSPAATPLPLSSSPAAPSISLPSASPPPTRSPRRLHPRRRPLPPLAPHRSRRGRPRLGLLPPCQLRGPRLLRLPRAGPRRGARLPQAPRPRACRALRPLCGGRGQYYSSVDLYRSPVASWRDTIQVSLGPTRPNTALIPPGCRTEILDWDAHATAVARAVMAMLSEALGLGAATLEEASCLEGKVMVCHYYPVCPPPERIMGIVPHTDPGVLTVLTQYGVGGLQMKHANENGKNYCLLGGREACARRACDQYWGPLAGSE